MGGLQSELQILHVDSVTLSNKMCGIESNDFEKIMAIMIMLKILLLTSCNALFPGHHCS